MRDRTPDIERLVSKYEGLEFVPLRIQEAFSSEWWRKVHASREEGSISVDMTSEGESPSPAKYTGSILTVPRPTTVGPRIVLYLHLSPGFACLSIVPANCDCRSNENTDSSPPPTATYRSADWFFPPCPRHLAHKPRRLTHLRHLARQRVQYQGRDAGRMATRPRRHRQHAGA